MAGDNRLDLQSQMLACIELGEVEGIKAVLAVHKAERGFTNLDCDEALSIACKHGNPWAVSVLSNVGRFWYTDEDGCKPIHRAVESCSVQTIQMAINNGASVRSLDSKGLSTLHYAAKYGCADVIKLLIQEGASVLRSVVDATNESALHVACCYGHEEAASVLLENLAEVNRLMKDSEEPSCLHVAVKNEHVNIVKLLCDHGANINTVDDKNKNTPLHLAVALNDGTIAKILLERGALVNAKNARGLTPLHSAVMNESASSLKVLLECEDIDVTEQDTKGLTALHYAAAEAYQLTEILLTKKHLDVNALRTSSGSTCLHYAAGAGNLEVVDILLKAGHQVNVVDRNGLTPLHSAIVKAPRSVEVVQRLLKAGALLDACSRNAPTPLHRFSFHYVIAGLNVDILKTLVSSGAHLGPPPNNTTRYQKSPLCLLTRYGQVDIVKYLVDAGWPVQKERDWINLQFGNASTNEILLLLRERIQQPWSLSECCRGVARKHLSLCSEGTEISSQIDKLHLPTRLKQFLKVQ